MSTISMARPYETSTIVTAASPIDRPLSVTFAAIKYCPEVVFRGTLKVKVVRLVSLGGTLKLRRLPGARQPLGSIASTLTAISERVWFRRQKLLEKLAPGSASIYMVRIQGHLSAVVVVTPVACGTEFLDSLFRPGGPANEFAVVGCVALVDTLVAVRN